MTIHDDTINSFWELGGAIFAMHGIWCLYRDKCVKGCSVYCTMYFTGMGIWNLRFYPRQNLWLSACASLVLVTVNAWWLILALYYSRTTKEVAT